MVSDFFSKYSSEEQKKLLKLFTKIVLCDEEIREACKQHLHKKNPNETITDTAINVYIKNKFIPKAIKDGSVQRILEGCEKDCKEKGVDVSGELARLGSQR